MISGFIDYLPQGRGKTNCAPCSGSGQVDKATPTEKQSGVIEKITCGMCKGSGSERCVSTHIYMHACAHVGPWVVLFLLFSCSTCDGKGHTTCETCSGAGRVKKYHQLTVTW